jgi:hypothetical protein
VKSKFSLSEEMAAPFTSNTVIFETTKVGAVVEGVVEGVVDEDMWCK